MLITANDVCGHLARWVCQQHPFRSVAGVDEVTAVILASAAGSEWFGPASCRMREFENWRAFDLWLHSVVDDHPQMMLWNTPRSQHSSSFVFSSSSCDPRPEDDFIDIDALLRNVSRSLWLEERLERDGLSMVSVAELRNVTGPQIL